MVKIHQDSGRDFPLGNGIVKFNTVSVKLKDKFNFECQHCGKCCYSPPAVNPGEASRIAGYKGIGMAEFLGDYVTFANNPGYGWKAMLNKKEDGSCTFLNEDKHCDIFRAAPRQCLAKPVALGPAGGRDDVVLRKMEIMMQICGGIGEGEETTVKEWIREKNLPQLWQEELDHKNAVEMWMYYPNSYTRVMDMFLKYNK